ncbi:MAG: sodium/glutamate symporter [Thermoplasmatota archaeon]
MAELFSFDQMIIFGIVSILLLIGLILRAKLRAFQKFFIPACITAGILGLVLKELGLFTLSDDQLKLFAYHLFNITFISLGLTSRPDAPRTKEEKRKGFRGVFSMGILIASVAALQFLIGGLCVLLLNLFGYSLHPTFGFLLTMGFEEGPGQALSMGQAWEGLGFVHASTIGLSFAMFGFLVAIFVGVPLASWIIRKGHTSTDSPEVSNDFRTGIYAKHAERESAGSLTTHSSAIDSLTVHTALIGVVYLITYGFVTLIVSILPSDISEMFWGFFFIWGLLFAFIIRNIIEKAGAGHVLDNQLQSRITGWGVDLLVVTSIVAISMAVVWEYIVPIMLMVILAAILTLLWVFYIGKYIWKEYKYERIAGVYGMETGTVATGLVLIRILDPAFRTPAATDLAISSIVALPFLFIMFNLMNGPILFGWSLGFTLLLFAVFEITFLVILKMLNFKWKKS